MKTVGDPAHLNKAIETIYSYFKGDQDFTEFMKDLEDFLAVGDRGHPVFTGEIGRHFDIAAELAQVMSPAPEAKYRSLVEGPALKLVMDRAFRIVAQSQEARQTFGYIDGFSVTLDRHNQPVIATGTTSYSPAQLDQLRSNLNGTVLASVAALFEHAEQGERPNRSFVRIESENGFASLLRNDPLDVVVITLPTPARGRVVPAMLGESLGLSPSEVEVLDLMARGKSNVEISKERFRSLDTVKSQTQAIFRKLGVASRLEAVQVVNDLMSLAALSGTSDNVVEEAVAEAQHFPFAHDPAVWLSTKRNGRRISYTRYPSTPMALAGKRQVLMFHGLLQSPEISHRLRQGLAQSGFDLIGASKPGYGATDKPTDDATFMRTSLEDARHVCDRHGASPVVVLGHLFGAHAAIEFCLAYPDQVSGLVLCSAYFPLQLADHLVPVGALQKLAMSSGIASAAAHQFIALTAVAYLRYGGSHRYLSTLAERSPADSAALGDREIYGLLRAGIRHVTGGGASAFLSDTASSNADWSHLLSRLDLPVKVIHGESDPAVNARLARLAAGRIARCEYLEVPAIGQHLLHVQPEMIVAALVDVSRAS